MPLRYKDYYEIIGVARDATAEQIQKAFRELARKFHPDVNKDPKALERFKEINEAYEVLKDSEKRQRYDQLGAGYRPGQEFEPPPGFGDVHFEFAGGGGGPSDFSDFFASLFGGRGFEGFGPGRGDGRAHAARPRRGQGVEAELTVSIEDLLRGGKTEFGLRGEDGNTRQIAVTIPRGTTQGSKIRLAGQGMPGQGGGPAGDLILKVRIARHPRYELDGTDLRVTVDVAPWEAALGATLDVETPDGKVDLKVAPGSQSGQTLRLRGLGLPRSGKERGDLLAKLRIVVPQELSETERRLFEQLRDESEFHPRG